MKDSRPSSTQRISCGGPRTGPEGLSVALRGGVRGVVVIVSRRFISLHCEPQFFIDKSTQHGLLNPPEILLTVKASHSGQTQIAVPARPIVLPQLRHLVAAAGNSRTFAAHLPKESADRPQ